MQPGCRPGEAYGPMAVEALAAYDVVAIVAGAGGFVFCEACVASAGPVNCIRLFLVAAVGAAFIGGALVAIDSPVLLRTFGLPA